MKRTFVFAIMVVLFAACSTKEIDTQTPLPGSEMFYATFEQPAEDDGTRVFVDRKFKVHWNEGDRVSVFNQNEMSDEYRFTGRTGDSGGSFELVYDTPDEWGNPLDHRYSIYPYTQETYWYADDVFSVELPSNQQYREDSFGPGANLMISATDNEEFKFKNACGYLVFKLYGEGAVSAITLEGNNGEHLAGNALITMPFGGVPLVEIESEATSRLSLTCSEPIVLGETANESTWFWFVVPPMTFSKGFTIKVHEASGGVIERSTFKSITIERNKVSMMLPVYVEASSAIPVNTPGAVSMGLSVLWGSFNLGASKPEDYGDFYAWGGD